MKIPPYTPLLCSKTGVCRGIPTFLIFAPKHRLWVLVRTAFKVDIFPMKINIVVMDVNNEVMYSGKSVDTIVVIKLLLHDVC